MGCKTLILILFIYQILSCNCQKYEDANHWTTDAQNRLLQKISSPLIIGEAKNVIFFLGDGLSVTTLTAARILKGQKVDKLPFGEEAELHMESFPVSGMSKTFCTDAQVADSACSATAYLGGTKAKYGTIGLTPNVTRKICEGQNYSGNHVKSLLEWAQMAGKSTGVITTTRITDASPTGNYAHVAERDWESDAGVRKDGQDPNTCHDIAEQLIELKPGKNINVILGGGRKNFLPNTTTDPEDPTVRGTREDGKDLLSLWRVGKDPRTSRFVTTNVDLLAVNTSVITHLFGLFAPDDLGYVDERAGRNDPSLMDMVRVGLEILKKNEKGFFLFVEGGLIDNAHHSNFVQRALIEAIEFDAAIQLGDQLTEDEDTLLVVTADHAHVMTFAGHSTRGRSILEYPDQFVETLDGLPYLTLSYANGPGKWSENGTRRNVSEHDLHNVGYQVPAAVPRNSETHAGDDVLIYAKGPFAHLLSGTHQQSYIPHVIRYAACLGDGAKYCDDKKENAGNQIHFTFSAVSTAAFFFARGMFLHYLFNI